MLISGDITEVDLGTPVGSEAGLRRPAVVVTAAGVLRGEPNVVQVVPLTRTIRSSGAEVYIEPDGQNHLSAPVHSPVPARALGLRRATQRDERNRGASSPGRDP